MIIQSIIDIPQICFQLGINYAIISPGSRNAHLTIAFARHPHIKTYVVPDERSAGYIALGMAQSAKQTVVLICTSGTATINYYPAISEAYYQNIPLLVLTADRPSKWIDKNDGQTIRQRDLYKNHIKNFYSFPEDEGQLDLENTANMVASAVQDTRYSPGGPVHINVPVNEPFYPEANEQVVFNKYDRLPAFKEVYRQNFFDQSELAVLENKKIAIVAGQGDFDEGSNALLAKLSNEKNIPVFSDTISNIHSFEGCIQYHDSFDLSFERELVPDVIISFGRSILSKRLKLVLRKNDNLIHYHVADNNFPADTYLSLKKVFTSSLKAFLSKLLDAPVDVDQTYQERLVSLQKKTKKQLDEFLSAAEFGEFKSFKNVLDAIPQECTIHLANSMPVRYTNILTNRKGWTIHANRGTSGIDGCSSTAVGHALHNSTGQHVLLTGDMAFFYDRNAFWHQNIPNNLKVIIFNNHGGGIFRLIDGPDRQPELETYFETQQKLTARYTALDFEMDYYFCDNASDLEATLAMFMGAIERAAILEIETDNIINQKIFKQYKLIIKNGT